MLMRRTPIAKKRTSPRRDEGRVQHKRIRGSISKTAEQRRFHDYVATLPCVGCGRSGVHVHHVISDGYKRLTRNHDLVLPVCADCHQDGPNAIHRIGSRLWNALHGIEQHIEAKKLREQFNG